jgi:integron integrase
MTENSRRFQTDPSLKLMDRVNQALAYYQYAYRTEKSYIRWIREYVRYLGKRKVPENRYQKEIDTFLDYLENEKHLSRSSRKQALNAISFLYKRVFDVPIDVRVTPSKIRKDPALPVIMTQGEVKQVLAHLKGKHLLMAGLLYGSGLRLMECVRLRIHQLDFKRNKILIRSVKGGMERAVMIPVTLREDLLKQVDFIRERHRKDIAKGFGKVPLPADASENYNGTESEFIWQYLFPAKKMTTDPRTGITGRFHVMESGLQKAVQAAVKKAGIQKPVSCSTFRHCFAVHLLQRNVNLQTVKELMGHADIRTTQIYMQLLEHPDITRISPLDFLE